MYDVWDLSGPVQAQPDQVPLTLCGRKISYNDGNNSGKTSNVLDVLEYSTGPSGDVWSTYGHVPHIGTSV